ncbi:unnamed protein product [Caenorhabditis brenneri]
MQCEPYIKAAFFYDYDGFVGNILCGLFNISSFLPTFLIPFELFTQFISIPLNLLHILILLRNPIRPSSVATFLMFIAFSNIFSMSWSIKFNTDYVFKPEVPVLIIPSYFDAFREFVLKTMENFGKRSSTWLGVGMAFCQRKAAKGSNPYIPILLYIFLFFSLRRKFKESNRIHQRDSIATPLTSTESFTKLVYYLTLTYFFVEFPITILLFCREFFVETFGMM